MCMTNLFDNSLGILPDPPSSHKACDPGHSIINAVFPSMSNANLTDAVELQVALARRSRRLGLGGVWFWVLGFRFGVACLHVAPLSRDGKGRRCCTGNKLFQIRELNSASPKNSMLLGPPGPVRNSKVAEDLSHYDRRLDGRGLQALDAKAGSTDR